MKKVLIIMLIIAAGYAIISCNGQLKAETNTVDHSVNDGTIPEYKWIKHTGNAAFPKSYNFQLFNFRDTLWAFHPAGNWYSLNGRDWTKSQLTNCINNLAFNRLMARIYFTCTIFIYHLTFIFI